MRYSFTNDYSEGAHPNILKAMGEENFVQSFGYGMDNVCEDARKLITDLIQKDADVHFMVGGTQTNLTVIGSALKSYEAVIAVESGHINVHETGAIEACGHKVLTAKGKNGKILPEEIEKIVLAHCDEHMVYPKMVYISNATEIGTYYVKEELMQIAKMCRKHHLYLFLDGARLGNALCAKNNDLTLHDLAEMCDVFYIGGTKNGALFGEAVVIVNDELKTNFRFSMKQRGGMLAKGKYLGIQFCELLKDGLYFELAQHANDMAQKIRLCLEKKGVSFLCESDTNQIFPILPDKVLNQLAKDYSFSNWEKVGESETAVRFVTSWATAEEAVETFTNDLCELLEI